MQLKAETWQRKQMEQAFEDVDAFDGAAECEAFDSRKEQKAVYMKKNKYWK